MKLTRKRDEGLKLRNKLYRSKPESIAVGLDRIKISVPVDRRLITWNPKRTQPRYRVIRRADGGITSKREVSYKCWKHDDHLRLLYNKSGYLIVDFEPDHQGVREGTDLLPFHMWAEVWKTVKETVEKALQAPGLFASNTVNLSYCEIAFDIFLPFDPGTLIHSMNGMPVSKRFSVISSFNENKNVKRETKSRRRTATLYHRVEKSGGYPVARLEFRLKSKTLKYALRIDRSINDQATALSSRNRMDHCLLSCLKSAYIYPGTLILPYSFAILDVANATIAARLERYEEWPDDKKYRYYVNRLRRVEQVVVGTSRTTSVVGIAGLYEAMIQAYDEAWCRM
ncbi:hypothetical protein KQI63_06430 [bacterium]|nr:hypothetical protein [bacterium]